MKQPKLERGKEDLISTGGNYLCGHILRLHAQAGLPENFQSRRSGAISDREVLMAMTGILCDGRSDFTNINLYAGDAVFANAFGIGELPSEATLRQRLDEMPQDRCHSALRQLNESILSERTFGTVRAGELDLIPVDIDVSPLDNSGSKKQGVSFTYKKHDGYAPIFAYIGSEGYMLDHELRPGSQHCQVGTAEFIGSCAETLERLRLAGRCLLRLDSGNDAEENFERFGDHYFIVKRNLRKEKLEQWLATARRVGELKGGTREGKNDRLQYPAGNRARGRRPGRDGPH